MTQLTVFQSQINSPLGEIRLAACDQGLVGVWFVHQQQHLPDSTDWIANPQHPDLRHAAQQIADYFSGQRQRFDLRLHLAWGTPFQQTVWQALQAIPFGQTSTYSALARAIGKPTAVRAVGGAIGQNPHSIVVPCHRVLGANGSLTGFAGGLDRKRYLLSHEVNAL